MLPVPRVIGVTKLLALHQLDYAGHLDSTVKSPSQKPTSPLPSLSLDD